jgi:hypothetical protein
MGRGSGQTFIKSKQRCIMNLSKEHVRFVLVVILAHTFAYLFAGGLSYQFVTKPLWEGQNPLLSAYLRTPGNPDLWNFAMTWQIPAQVLRSLLMGLVLLPLFDTLKQWNMLQRFSFLSALFFVFTHLSSAAPSPANIEGLVYVKPEFVQLGFFLMQIEMILYSLLTGFIAAKWLFRVSSVQKS